MKIVMIGGIYPKGDYEHIVNSSKGVIQYAADALQKAILCGLSYHTNNSLLVNLPFIGAYPIRYNKLFLKSSSFQHTTPLGDINAINVKFCNLIGYKQISRYLQLKRTLIKLQKNTNEETIFFVYAITPSFLKACCDVKKKYSNIRIVLLVPDLPEFMSDNANLIYKIYKWINNLILSSCYKSVDGWVLLSKYMSERLPVKKNNWIVMEGIYNNFSDDVSVSTKQADRYILYAGTLAKRYGVQTLVRAFHVSNITGVKLYICGAGDSLEMIESYARKDSRIVYLGQLKRVEVLELQQYATLLVNPRTPEGEFTKYSFPSKTMEYLASGVPTLMYKLPGIPEEYFNHCYTIEGLGEKPLAHALESIFKEDYATLKQMGINAKKFILEKKNPVVQMGEIIKFINNL